MPVFAFSQILILIFPLYLLCAAILDLKTLRIPNRFNLAGLPLFAAVFMVTSMPLDMIGWHALTGLLILLVGFGAFAAGFFGGGDAKFLAVIALWLGYQALIPFFFHAAIIAGVMALLVLIGGRLIPSQYQPAFFKAMVDRKVIPYGTAMSLAALYVYPETPLWALLMS